MKIPNPNTKEDFIKNEKLHQNIFNNITLGFALCELIYNKQGEPIDYRFLKINNAFEKQSGIKIETAIGKTIKEIYPTIEQSWIDKYSNVVIKNKAINFEDYNHNTKKHYQVNAFSPSANKFVMLFEDITYLKNTETKLKSSKSNYKHISDSMLDMFQVIELVYDENGSAIDYLYLDVNPAFEKLVNKDKSYLIGKRAKALFGIVEGSWIKAYDKVEKTGIPEIFEDLGVELDKLYKVSVWKIGARKLAVAFNDITETKRAVKNLIRSEELLNHTGEIAKIGGWGIDVPSI